MATLHTSGGSNDWREVHEAMRARGWFGNTRDSYWHSRDGYRAKVRRIWRGEYEIDIVEHEYGCVTHYIAGAECTCNA